MTAIEEATLITDEILAKHRENQQEGEKMNDWQKAIEIVESDYCGSELVTENVPYNKEQWQAFREEVVKYMNGQHADYVKVGRFFIEEAAKYAEKSVDEL